MEPPPRRAITTYLRRYDSLLEIGIGRRPEVADALALAGARVAAIDVHDRSVPDGVAFRVDDVVARSESETIPAYYDVDAIYGLNLPPELHRPTARVADRVGAACCFTTLGFDEPAISVDRVAIDGPGGPIYVVR
ncbi:MAG: UPF0146 family protein [Halobacteriota archaeon]